MIFIFPIRIILISFILSIFFSSSFCQTYNPNTCICNNIIISTNSIIIGKRNVDTTLSNLYTIKDLNQEVPKPRNSSLANKAKLRSINTGFIPNSSFNLKDKKIHNGGPVNALYSILIPGLGDYFVKDSRSMIIKPYMRTISTLGLVGLGIIASQKREMVPIMSVRYINVRYDSNNDGAIDGRDNLRYTEVPIVIGKERKVWLFENDAEVFFITGIIMWGADVIWVFAKGTENEK